MDEMMMRPAEPRLSGRCSGEQLFLRHLLAGKPSAHDLREAFVWKDTPQGYDYWDRIREDLEKGKSLPQDAREYVQTLLVASENASQKPPAAPETVDVEAEVAAWFRGGRCLETGPAEVKCCLECTRQRRWYLYEQCATTGELISINEIDERIAWHIILASDVSNLLFEQKVMKCLKGN